MRIVSKFRDYYDGVQAHDAEREPLYRRTQKEIYYTRYNFYLKRGNVTGETVYPLQVPLLPLKQQFWYGLSGLNFLESHTIVFCGKIYPVLQFGLLRNGPRGEKQITTVCCYSTEEVDILLQSSFSEKQQWSYRQDDYKKVTQHWVYEWRRDALAAFFVLGTEQVAGYAALFDEYKAPVFIGNNRNKTVTVNGCLKDLEFYQVLDSYQAYQEISMWMGNQADPGKVIPKISDEVLAEAKGFDKWSFRKEPSRLR